MDIYCVQREVGTDWYPGTLGVCFQDVFEMQAGSLPPGARVLVVDDLIATGGSAKAAGELVKKNGGVTVEYLFVVAIPFLKGAEVLDAPVYAYVFLPIFARTYLVLAKRSCWHEFGVLKELTLYPYPIFVQYG